MGSIKAERGNAAMKYGRVCFDELLQLQLCETLC